MGCSRQGPEKAESLFAEAAVVGGVEAEDAAHLVANVTAVRSTCLERNDFRVPGLRPVHGGHTTARQRMQIIEGVRPPTV